MPKTTKGPDRQRVPAVRGAGINRAAAGRAPRGHNPGTRKGPGPEAEAGCVVRCVRGMRTGRGGSGRGRGLQGATGLPRVRERQEASVQRPAGSAGSAASL